MIENGSRSEGIPGVFQATRVVLYSKAALPGVMGSAPFGYNKSNAKHIAFTLRRFILQLFTFELEYVIINKKEVMLCFFVNK